VLDKVAKFTHLLSGWLEWVGLAGLLLIMVITCVDVAGAKIFIWRVPGAIDIVMLSQLVAIGFAVAFTQILGKHVRVEFLVAKLPGCAQAVIGSIINLFLLALFILISWRVSVFGHSLQIAGEVSASASIPLYPFAYGVAFACIPVCLLFLLDFLSSLAKVIKR